MIVTAADGVTLHCDVTGPDDGPVVVFLHGATLDRRSWDAQVEALSGAYRCVTVDLRGHGESVMDRPFVYADAVRDVSAVLAAIGDRPTVLVGLSMGGNIVQSVLRDAPPQVVGAVLADCAWNTAPRPRGTGAMIAMSLAMLKAYPRQLFLRQVATRTALTPEVRAYVLEVSSRMPHARVVEVMDALTRAAIAPEPGWRVPVPTLLLCGTGDKLAAIRKELPAWAEVDPGCTFTWVPEAGHASNQDNPAAFNALLLAHLEQVLHQDRAAQ